MTYRESVRWLDSLSRLGISPGLERVRALCAALSDPQDFPGFIHVAGTNGKGSVCCMLSGILKCSGYKTGLFTSPFCVSVREQLQVNGEYISENDFAALLTRVRGAAEALYLKGVEPTEFETLTAAAFLYFRQSGCDFAVIECGMGGQGDCTNIIPPPLIAVITSVSLDHTAFLGRSTAEIAREKSGIIKSGCVAVSYPSESFSLGFEPQDADAVRELEKAAQEKGCELHFAHVRGVRVAEACLFSTDIETPCGRIHIPFGGAHQTANALTALECVKRLREAGYCIPDAAVREGIQEARMPARLEKLSENPLVILDGGHNPGCAGAVAAAVREYAHGRELTVLAAMMADKDFDASFGQLLPLAKSAVCTSPRTKRAADAGELAEKAAAYCKNVRFSPDSGEALKMALELTRPDGILLICGSFYLAAEIKGEENQTKIASYFTKG